MFVEYFDLKRPAWDAETIAAILTRLQGSGYQSLVTEISHVVGRYTHTTTERNLSGDLLHIDPFTDVLTPPGHKHARLIVHRPDSDTFRVVSVGRTHHEVRMAATAVKMHLEAILGTRISELIVDENGRISLTKFRQEVLGTLGFTGDGMSGTDARPLNPTPILMALRLQPVIQGAPTVLGSQLATLAPDRPADQTREALDQLVADGLIARWHVVVCREHGQWLAVSPTADEVRAFSALSLSCPHCGKRVSEEQSDVAYRLGSQVAEYLSDNRWICQLIESPLRKQGVEAVVMEPGKGGVDGAACYHSAVLLFRAKDGAATARDVIELKALARRLEGDGWRVYPVLVTTAASDVKTDGVTVVDNLNRLDVSLDHVLTDVRERSLNTLLPGVLRPAAVLLADLLPIDPA